MLQPRRSSRTLSCALFTLIVCGQGIAGQAGEAAPQAKPLARGYVKPTRSAQLDTREPRKIILKGDVSCRGLLPEDLQSSMGLVCSNEGNGMRISQVRPGSEAYRKGLKPGDRITDVQTDNSGCHVVIERGNQKYVAQLGGQSTMSSQEPAFDSQPQQPFNLKVQNQRFELNSKQVAVLRNFNLELIIDRSRSMRKRDCPGGLSRWDWCGKQAVDIAGALAADNGNCPTITRFAWEFDVHEHCSTADVAELLSRKDFQFGTRLCEPLAARLESHFRNHKPGEKPLLIAVITDGCPFPKPEPRMVVESLIQASKRMRTATEVSVVFLQVGDDNPRGRRYLTELGTNLVSYGARFQYVHVKTFDQVADVGLVQALVDSVRQSSIPREVAGSRSNTY